MAQQQQQQQQQWPNPRRNLHYTAVGDSRKLLPPNPKRNLHCKAIRLSHRESKNNQTCIGAFVGIKNCRNEDVYNDEPNIKEIGSEIGIEFLKTGVDLF